MGVFKNGVGRPSNETIKKRNIFKGICVILVLIIIGLLGYIVNDKFNILENKKVTEVEKNKKEVVDNKIAEKVITSIFGEGYAYDFQIRDFNEDLTKELFAFDESLKSSKEYDIESNFKYTGKDLTGSYVLEDSEHYGTYSNIFYDYDKVNENYKKLFVTSKDLSKKDIEGVIGFSYLYSKNCNCYAQYSEIFGDGGHTPLSSITQAYKLGNKLYVELLFADASFNDINDNTLTLNDGTEIKLTDKQLKDKDILIKYEDKLDVYEFIFDDDKGTYKFRESRKKVK